MKFSRMSLFILVLGLSRAENGFTRKAFESPNNYGFLSIFLQGVFADPTVRALDCKQQLQLPHNNYSIHPDTLY